MENTPQDAALGYSQANDYTILNDANLISITTCTLPPRLVPQDQHSSDFMV